MKLVDILCVVIAFAVVIDAFVWFIFGIGCIGYCGMNKVESKVIDIDVKIEVCQTTDSRGWYYNAPYTGYGHYCFHIYKEDPSISHCFYQKVSCADTEDDAFRIANITNPIGSQHLTWWYESDGSIWIDFTLRDMDINHWLWVSIWITVSLVSATIVITTVVIVKCKRTKKINVEDHSDEQLLIVN